MWSCCGYRRRGGSELGQEGREILCGERTGLAVEVVDAEVAEVIDVRAELVGCGGHESIVRVVNPTRAILLS